MHGSSPDNCVVIPQLQVQSRLADNLISLNHAVANFGWSAAIDAESHRSPVRTRGLRLLESGGTLVIPICLNNGYYKRETVHHLIRTAAALSNSISIFFTDGPSKHNYIAAGKSESSALRDCRRHFNRLRNFCVSGVDILPTDLRSNFDLDLHRWSRIYKRSDWQEEFRYLLNLYESRELFRDEVRSTTRQVLEKRMGCIDLEQRTDVAINYTLEELAFILIASRRTAELENSRAGRGKIEGASTPFAYIYYESWPVMERLVDGCYDGIVRENIGFCILDLKALGDNKQFDLSGNRVTP